MHHVLFVLVGAARVVDRLCHGDVTERACAALPPCSEWYEKWLPITMRLISFEENLHLILMLQRLLVALISVPVLAGRGRIYKNGPRRRVHRLALHLDPLASTRHPTPLASLRLRVDVRRLSRIGQLCEFEHGHVVVVVVSPSLVGL